jgi:hypothetical protein
MGPKIPTSLAAGTVVLLWFLGGGCGSTNGSGGSAGIVRPRPIVETFQIDPRAAQDLKAASGVGLAFAAGSLEIAGGGSPAPRATVELANYLGDPSLLPTDMPGSFHGQDQSGASVSLASFGVMGVTITDSSGAQLNLKAGSTATLTIPSTGGDSGPGHAPLWYLPDNGDTWKEEGSAQLAGSVYHASVPHFSLWNVDIACNHACVHGIVTDGAGKPLGGVEVLARATTSTCQWFTPGALSGGATVTLADGSYQVDWLPGDSVLELQASHLGDTVSTSVTIPARGDACVEVDPLVFGGGGACGEPPGGCPVVQGANVVPGQLRPGCCTRIDDACNGCCDAAVCADTCGYAWYEMSGVLYGPCASGDQGCIQQMATTVTQSACWGG